MDGRLLMLEPVSIAEYMALSETLQVSVADGSAPTVFVSPGWVQKGVSIGKYQRASSVNLDACNMNGLEAVRRPTEGYALIHCPDDFTYGIAIPRRLAFSKRDFDERMVLPVLIRSLERAGVQNAYDPFPERYGNVYANGKKISGSAQNRDKNAWLQHGIIVMRRRDPQDYSRYFSTEKEPSRLGFRRTSVEELGFLYVASGPFVRSSYKAGELFIKHVIKSISTQRSMQP